VADNNLRAGWKVWRFDQMAESIGERADPTPEDSELYVGLEHMDTDSLRVRRWGSKTDLIGQKLKMRNGDILFARRNAYLKRVAIAPHDGLFSAHGMILRAKQGVVLPEFLPLFMQSDLFMDRAIQISVGSMSPTINWKALAVQEFALPPMEEQRRIADAMEAIDEQTESLLLVHDRTAELFRSLLDSMWHECPKHKIGSLVSEGVLEPPQDGNHGEKHPKASDYVTSGIPFVMASDLHHGAVDFIGCKKIPEEIALNLRIGFAKRGDVLLSHKGTVGCVALLDDMQADFAMLTPQVTYYRSRDESRLLRKWLYFAFQTPEFQRLLERYGKQSTRSYVGITTQRELSVPFPDRLSQEQFVQELEELEGVLSSALARKEKTLQLRRSLLQTALTI